MMLRRKDITYVLLSIVFLCFSMSAYFSIFAESHLKTILSTNGLVESYLSRRQMKLHTDESMSKMPEEQIKGAKADEEVSTREPKIVVSPAGDIEGRFQRRRKLQQDACLRYKPVQTYPVCGIYNTGVNFKYVNESGLIYCAIEKAGSTFWKRILHVIGGWSNDTNPTSIKSEDADDLHGGFRSLKNSSLRDMRDIFNISKSLMFVRSPFTRLFSAWLDKFYSPNPYYWTNAGPQIVKAERLNTENFTEHSSICAPDISFTEFINFTVKAINSRVCVDGHFAPNYQHCLPCYIPFDYIGKYETFKEDTIYLLNKLNLSDKVVFDDFEGDATLDAIKGSSDFVFSQKENIKDCNVSFHCALFKLWNRMQSRGILSKKLHFPYQSVEDVQNVTLDEFIGVLKKANRDSYSNETKANRKEALQQAYQHLPSDLKKRLVKTFEIDFTMFEYDSNPDFLNTTTSRAFNYFKEC